MFSASNLCKNVSCMALQARYKHKPHWAKQRKKISPETRAMAHFDEFYGSMFRKQWEPMREALLRRRKYVAVVNNYGDTEETVDYLTNRGAHCLQNLMTIQQEFHKNYVPAKPKTEPNTNNRLAEYATRLQADEISNLYSQASTVPETIDTAKMILKRERKRKDPYGEDLPKKEDLKEVAEFIDDTDPDSRYIDPSVGLTSAALNQYVPTTELIGMEEWVPESAHYSYLAQSKDFPLQVEPETEFSFPEHLKVFTYEMDSDMTEFPEPRRGQTGVMNYYPMDCGSVLTVLALCLQPGDRVLDLCSAPGGKALVALQTLLPDIVVCNDSSLSRANRISRIFGDYLIDFGTSNKWRERVLLSNVDGREFTDDRGFDKVLVDVPCTADRHSLRKEANNIFRPDRVKERLKLPELQSELLVNALRLTKLGGAVVYSTCSLSPIQNDGVVNMALKMAFEEYGITATVKDLTDSLSGFTSTLRLGEGAVAPRFGQLITPSVGANFGPTYFARLVRTT